MYKLDLTTKTASGIDLFNNVKTVNFCYQRFIQLKSAMNYINEVKKAYDYYSCGLIDDDTGEIVYSDDWTKEPREYKAEGYFYEDGAVRK